MTVAAWIGMTVAALIGKTVAASVRMTVAAWVGLTVAIVTKSNHMLLLLCCLYSNVMQQVVF